MNEGIGSAPSPSDSPSVRIRPVQVLAAAVSQLGENQYSPRKKQAALARGDDLRRWKERGAVSPYRIRYRSDPSSGSW